MTPASNTVQGARALACLGAGAIVALVPAVLGPTSAQHAATPATSGARAPVLWVCDRDAGQVLRLDRELLVTGAKVLPRPVHVAALEDGGAWVVSAIEGRPKGAHRVVRLDHALEELASHVVGPVLELAAGEAGELWVLERQQEGHERVLQVDDRGPPVVVFESSGARALGASGGWVAVGDNEGRLEAWGPGGERWTASLPGPVDAILGIRGGWWIAVGEAPGQRSSGVLVRMTHEGGLVAAAPASMNSPRLAPAPEDGVWVCDAVGTVLERRDAFGEPVFVRELPYAVALGPLVVLAERGPVIATSGALLCLDAEGALVRGQGGFDRLVALAAVPFAAVPLSPSRRATRP